MKERWRKIPFFTGYEISDRGRVRSFKRTRPKILKPEYFSRGDRKKTYLRVTLQVRGRKKHRKIHRLVALAFLPRVKGKNTVDHVDGNTHNNRVTNLEWVTNAENIKRAWDNGLMKHRRVGRGKVRRNKR